MSEFIFYVLITLAVLVFFYAIGTLVERRHRRSLDAREAALAHIITTNLKQYPSAGPVSNAVCVDGQAVIGSDYYKTFTAGTRKFFGGEMRSIESLMTRARREALVRLLVKADAAHATHVLNVRFEASTIARGQGNNKGLIAAEIHAYGTAIKAE